MTAAASSRGPVLGELGWRHALTLQCAYEIEELSKVLLVLKDSDGFAVRGIALRLEQLAGVVLSAIDDESDTQESLAQAVFGTEGGQRWSADSKVGSEVPA